MHDQRKAVDNAAEDQRDERAVVVHVLETWPTILRTSDLIRELSGSDEFADRDRIDRAVRSLIQTGLLVRCDDDVVMPTRQTALAYELFNE